ncbi:MAG: hypothetical protein ACOH2J_09145 [Allorhizobium sp.]
MIRFEKKADSVGDAQAPLKAAKTDEPQAAKKTAEKLPGRSKARKPASDTADDEKLI